MSTPEHQLASGLWVVEPAGPPTLSDFTERVPNHSCYPLGQYVRFLANAAADPGTVVDINRSDIDFPTLQTKFLEAQEDAIAACTRVCKSGCVLSVLQAAAASRLEVVVDISDREQLTFDQTLEFIEASRPEDEDQPLSAGAAHIKGVITKRLEALAEQVEDFNILEIDDGVYTFFANFTGGRFHSILRIMEKLLKTSAQQETASEADFTLEDPSEIHVQDVVNLLLHQDREFHYYVNLGSTPRDQI